LLLQWFESRPPGGRVLVKACVQQILHDGKKAVGVKVKHLGTGQVHNINAPCIVSDAGIQRTFDGLLPPHVARNSYYSTFLTKFKPSVSMVTAFIGLNASNKKLNLRSQNIYALENNDYSGEAFTQYLALSRDEAMKNKPPFVFVCFPSAKNPNWEDLPGTKFPKHPAVFYL
jgi:all-trans-retinol 13,14-reductase